MINGEKILDHSIRWGMVGGGRGSNIGYIHRSAALRDNNFQLIAGAFDIDEEKGVDFGKEIGVIANRCYKNYKTLFLEEAKREDGIEAVSIATPNGTHYEIGKAALEAGIHVICEKPLCFTYEEAKELVALATENNLIFGVMYGYTGHQMIQQAKQMLMNGDLGDIRLINMQFAHGSYNTAIEAENPSAKWRLDPKNAGPSFILGDVGTHAFYLAEAMIPNLKIEKLLCVTQSFVEGRQLEDNAHVFINFEKGIFGNLWASGMNAGSMHGQKIRIIGSKASLEWWDERPNQLSYEVEGEPVRILERGAKYLYLEATEDDRIGGGHAVGLFESWSNLYRRFAQAIDATFRGDEEFLEGFWYPSVKDGAEGVKFVETCLDSVNLGSVWVEY